METNNQIFLNPNPTMRELHVSLNYPDTNIKKMACAKNVWMWRYSGTDWKGGIKIFLKGGREESKNRGLFEMGGR